MTRLVRAVDDRPLLTRILDVPHLAQVVPRLAPELLHRVIQTCGLEDCGELVALITPDQLRRVLDLDLWRPHQPGQDDRFDADRFGVWLDVLVDADSDGVVAQLAKIDVDLVVTGFAQHVRVFDVASLRSSAGPDDGVQAAAGADGELTCDIGGYHVVARRAGSWNAVVSALIALDADDPDRFHRIMRGCRKLSNSLPEIDGLHDLLQDGEQAAFELALDRERRREQQGFVTPAQARAFLQMSRQSRPAGDRAPASTDPIALAYFRSLNRPDAGEATASPTPPADAHDDATNGDASVAFIIDLLRDAGVVSQPRGLPAAAHVEARPLATLHAQLQAVFDADESAAADRTQELGFLANVLAAGCSVLDRAMTPQEASDAAAAICNLGLENWPIRRSGDVLRGHGLVTVFQAGWRILHTRVCLRTAERLIATLSTMRCADREIQFGLDVLRIEMAKHARAGAPWHARRHLDAIAMLDMPAWAALLALTGELPVLHGAVAALSDAGARSVSATAFEFIGMNSQVAAVDRFLDALPDIL